MGIKFDDCIKVENICEEVMGMTYRRVLRLYNSRTLPIPAFKFSDSQRAPLFVTRHDLDEYATERRKRVAKELAAMKDVG